jgi:multidrug resistance efflux pump
MRGKWLLAGAVLVAVAIAGGAVAIYRHGAAPRAVTPPKPPPTPPPSEVEFTGRIQPTKVVDVAVPVDGIVERFLAGEGDDVFEGEVLAHIKSPKLDAGLEAAQADAEHARDQVASIGLDQNAARLEASRLQSELTRAKAEYALAEKEYARQSALVKEGATPRLTFEKAEKDYNTLKASIDDLTTSARNAQDRVEQLTKDLAKAQNALEQKNNDLEEAKAELAAGDVHSPGDGVVMARHGHVGELVDKTLTDLFQVAVDLGTLQLTVAPDPHSLARIQAGQKVMISVAQTPDPITGAVREIKDGQVVIWFDSPSPLVKPGVAAQVKIKLS